jgi:histidine triad (HIT) family protein
MKNKDCIFCKIVKGEIPSTKIWENENIIAFMDIQPINKGHILIIPKEHAQLIIDLKDNILEEIIKMTKKLDISLRNSNIKCEGVNLLLADGESAGQEVFHVHFHIIPRFKNDGFGFKFPKNYKDNPTREELNKIAEEIKKKL